MSSTVVARLSGLLFASAIAACAGRLHTADDVSGLPADGEAAVIFAPGIVSTGDVFASSFTPDGRTVVFTKFSPPRPMSLMTSSYANGHWSAPVVLPFSGTYRDLDPAFSPDGSRLYFSSARPSGPTAADTATGVDTWYVERTASGWSSPVRLPEPVNGVETDMYPSVTRSGVLYFDSYRSRPRRRLVYRAAPMADGSLGAPEQLDAIVNADSGASNLFVDAEERYVVFAAVRPDGAGGPDLYISARTAGGWTDPRNLGPLVNSEAVEFCPFVSRDGKYLYFTRITTKADKTLSRNVHLVRFDGLRERSLAK